MYANVLFLRPFFSSRRYTIPNKFVRSEWNLPFPKEFPYISLECALLGALGQGLPILKFGGPSDALGMTKMMTASICNQTVRDCNLVSGWTDTVTMLIETCRHIILMIAPSKGMKWELAHLVSTGRILDTTLLMAPAWLAPELAATWRHLASEMQLAGIHLPEYDPAGAFLQVDRDMSIEEKIPFESIFSDILVEFVLRAIKK